MGAKQTISIAFFKKMPGGGYLEYEIGLLETFAQGNCELKIR